MSWRGTLTYAHPSLLTLPTLSVLVPLPSPSAPVLPARRLLTFARPGSPAARRFNKYIQIAARATRNALKEEERLKAEKRGAVTLKWQTWKDGKGSAQVSATPTSAHDTQS